MGRVVGGQLDLDRLAGGRPGLGNRDLDVHPRNAHHRLAQIGKDGIGVLPFAPVDEFVLDRADHIGVDLVALPAARAGPGIDRLDPRPAKDALFGLGDQRVLLGDGKVAARLDVKEAEFRFDIGEEDHALAVVDIGIGHRPQKTEGKEEHDHRMPHRLAHDPHVRAVLVFGRVLEGLGDDRAKGRHEDQRIDQRGGKGDDQGDRQVFHELANDAGPEEQRREGGDAGHGGGDHRPGHPMRGHREGLAFLHPLGHPAFGEFGDDDRVVDQHPDGEDQREEDDDVDGVTHQ